MSPHPTIAKKLLKLVHPQLRVEWMCAIKKEDSSDQNTATDEIGMGILSLLSDYNCIISPEKLEKMKN